MSYSEDISDLDLRIEILEFLRERGAFQFSDFLSLLPNKGNYGIPSRLSPWRVRVADNLIAMHLLGWIQIEPFNGKDVQSLDPTQYIDFNFDVTPQGLEQLKRERSRTPKRTTRQTVQVAKPQSIRALVLQQKYPKPRNEKSANERIAKAIATRLGQQKFRQALLDTYGHCLVTGYEAEDVLESAHIRPYAGGGTFDLSNGLLLRADIHTLFDLGLIAVDTKNKNMTVIVASALIGTEYEDFNGKPLKFSGRPMKSLIE